MGKDSNTANDGNGGNMDNDGNTGNDGNASNNGNTGNDGSTGSGGNMGNDGREQLFWNLNFYCQNYCLYDTNTHDTRYTMCYATSSYMQCYVISSCVFLSSSYMLANYSASCLQNYNYCYDTILCINEGCVVNLYGHCALLWPP